MLDTLLQRASALGYRACVQTGSISLGRAGEEPPRLFYYVEDAEAFLDRRHLSCLARFEKQIGRDAEQLARILADPQGALTQFEQYWSERQFLFGRLLTWEHAQALFARHYAEGLNELQMLRLKASQAESASIVQALKLPAGYTLDMARGDGWIYPQYMRTDIPRSRERATVYRFRTEDGARQFIQKAAQKLTRLLPSMPAPQRPLLLQKG